MANNKKPRKRYNPQAKRAQRKFHMASQCIAYQWEAHHDPDRLTLNCSGPYSDAKNIELIQWALASKQRWIYYAVACYVDDHGEYYEDFVNFEDSTHVSLHHELAVFKERKELAIQSALEGGNPRHLVSTVFGISLQSTDLGRKMETDHWLKHQSEYRSQYVLSQWRALRAPNDK